MSGFSVYDYIKIMKSPVKTVCIGDVASMSAMIFISGEKREIQPYSWIFIHDQSYGHLKVSSKKPHEVQHDVDIMNKVREKFRRNHI